LASHNQEIAERFCTKALWLEKGRVKRLGAVDEVMAEYLASATDKSGGTQAANPAALMV